MNKFNIDQYLYYNCLIDILDQDFHPVLVIVRKIEKIDNGQIIYTVKFVKFIGFDIKSARELKQEKQLSEGCLFTDLNTLKAIFDKSKQ